MMLKKVYIKIVMFSAALLFFSSANATHIVGGELNYKYLGVNTYEIKLTLYRDCGNPANAPYDEIAWIGFFDQNNDSVGVLKIPFVQSDTLPLSINSVCAKVPNGICYEFTEYIDTVILPPIPGGYQIVYQRCCWNLTVTNIKNPSPNPNVPQGSSGLTITANIPDVNVIAVNSNPIFQELTPPFICHGTEFRFNHEAIDPDGDSLAYRIVTPYNAPLANAYQFPPSPPYAEVAYQTGYSLANVMGGDPLKVDPVTGFVTAKPNTIGQFVFAVEVLEFRSGVQIGANRRSYQLNTDYCPDLTYAFIESADALCGQTNVDFENKSIGASNFIWEFGDPSNPGGTSTAQEPSYTYPGPGTYTIKLIAISDLDTAICNDTTFKEIVLAAEYDASATFNQDLCLNQAEFYGNASVIGAIPNKWFWDFGDGQFDFVQNPVHFFNKVDVYEVKMIAELAQNHLGCIDSVFLTYNAQDNVPPVTARADKYTLYKRADSVFLEALSPDAVSYKWKPAGSLNDPSIRNPIAKPEVTTTYVVTITDALGCTNLDSITLSINPYRCGESDIYVPNAFTPNNDGENDFFRVRGEDIRELYLAVYNRWGQLVFESSDSFMIQNENFGWDGTYNGEPLSSGVFVYYLKAICPGDSEFIKKGNVTLLR